MSVGRGVGAVATCGDSTVCVRRRCVYGSSGSSGVGRCGICVCVSTCGGGFSTFGSCFSTSSPSSCSSPEFIFVTTTFFIQRILEASGILCKFFLNPYLNRELFIGSFLLFWLLIIVGCVWVGDCCFVFLFLGGGVFCALFLVCVFFGFWFSIFEYLFFKFIVIGFLSF